MIRVYLSVGMQYFNYLKHFVLKKSFIDIGTKEKLLKSSKITLSMWVPRLTWNHLRGDGCNLPYNCLLG